MYLKWLIIGILCLLASLSAWLLLRKKQPGGPCDERPLTGLLFVLPFAVGGFYSFLSPFISAFLIAFLFICVKKKKLFTVYLNDSLSAIILVFVGYSFSFLWATDSGMAAFGFLRVLPLILFVFSVMQLEKPQINRVVSLIPLCGAVMTVISFPMQYISPLSGFVTVSGRLAGFFEYPNTYAAFLIAGLVIEETSEEESKLRFFIDAILMLGVFLSGGRTAFALLALIILCLCIIKRKLKPCLVICGIFAACVLISYIVGKISADSSLSRFMTSSAQSSTFLGRILYFKDAAGEIISHPFGFGYWGYSAAQGSFQNGVYSVTYVHNELIQLLLDIGWIPTLALCVAIIKSFFSKGASARNRLLTVAIVGHCMMDFDLQFSVMWLLLLSTVDFHSSKPVKIRRGKVPAAVICGATLLLSLWLSAGDILYNFGFYDLCSDVTPFHTLALTQQLTEIEDVGELETTADRILFLNQKSSIAHSAKANAAYSKGDIENMMTEKETAIECNRYSLNEYCDYFEKLYQAMLLYEQNGDTASAEVCREKMQSIPLMLDTVRQSTDPIAWKIADQPQLELPAEYQKILNTF